VRGRYRRCVTRRLIAISILMLSLTTACSSSGSGKPAATSGQARQCSTLDTALGGLVADYNSLKANTMPPNAPGDLESAAYNISQAQDAATGTLNIEIQDTVQAVRTVEDALATGNVSDQLAALRNTYTTVATTCSTAGYPLKNALT